MTESHTDVKSSHLDLFSVSVIIPAYNAARFVTQAVESALSQPETGEVILIEDGSPDGSLHVCQKLAEKYEKVRLLQHPRGVNKGAGASRNLGMQNAKFDYIAFLDADDFFLPGRFFKATEVFEANPDCEGVYEAIGRHVENKAGLSRWEAAHKPDTKLHTVITPIPPEGLAKELINGIKGDFSLNGLVIKKSALEKTGYMNESLRLDQDTDFILRMAIKTTLLPGRLSEPVAIWRIHEQNRVSAQKSANQERKRRLKFWVSFYKWCEKNASSEIQSLTLNKMLEYVGRKNILDRFPRRFFSVKLLRLFRLTVFLLEHPVFLKKFRAIKQVLIV